MERTAVRSKDIAIVGYDASMQVLEVAFKTGGVYHYQNVPESVHQAFLKAPSQGIYFRDQIREKYPSQKIK